MSDPKPKRPVKRRPGQPQLIELVGGPFDGERHYLSDPSAFAHFASAEHIVCDGCGRLYAVAEPWCPSCALSTGVQSAAVSYALRTRSDGNPVMPLQVGQTTRDGALLYDHQARP